AREGAFLVGLNDQPVRVPRCFGVSPDGTALLLERLEGTASTLYDSDNERETIMHSYVRELVALHSIDPRTLRLPVVTDNIGRSPALVDLDEFVDAYRRLCPRHEEFERVVTWLEEHAPEVRDEVVLLHGDTGPGNFLHHHGEV